MKCPNCHFENPQDFRYCGSCGHNLEEQSVETAERSGEIAPERKQATVLFSDLAGYTALTEKLDPEEVKEVMGRIFGEIGRLAKSYDGTIERFFGDEVLLLFGVPKAHEDDPIRAIRVALEIHTLINQQSARLAEKIGRPLAMHIGINTGLVITGDEYIDKGRHGLTGDAVNLGARLAKLSKPGETLVGSETYRQTMHHFEFAALGPSEVKGKSEPIQIYKVLSPKEKPSALHRTHGAQADLIGRDEEMAVFNQAVDQLLQGQGSIISVCGDAGTGKSRLTREFKDQLDLGRIQWYEGHAYGYTQNTPYYPLIDLLTRAFQIEESDPSERIREKIESGVAYLLGAENKAAAYIGGLFSLSYPEVTQVSPEFWKSRLHESIHEIVSALANRGTTVICFEDLHWADPSFIELLNPLLKSPSQSILFVCVYRPSFSPFDTKDLQNPDQRYHEIRLHELSASDAQAMLRSLLKSGNIPAELMDFIGKKAEGNPFYLEEVINSLIESDILTRDNGRWKLTRSIGEADIPSSINGVLTARIDRLQKDSKRILQEASVIGRAFFYEILKRISDLKVPIDQYLAGLEQLDLIRVRAFEPDLEYIFKHALTQEVVYNGILKKERQAIHERIGLAIEMLFKERLSEFYETLAFHYLRGKTESKAIDYLIQSGEKSLKQFAVEESQRYYEQAYSLLTRNLHHTLEETSLLITLLNKWALVHYYRGDFKNLERLFRRHEDIVESIGDVTTSAMYYAWLGFILYARHNYKDSRKYLLKALKMSEEAGEKRVEGYALAWLTFLYSDLGLFDDSLSFADRAIKIAKTKISDPYILIKPLGGIAQTYFYSGHSIKAYETGKLAVQYGNERSNVRGIVMGYIGLGVGRLTAGDFSSAVEHFNTAIEVSADPLYRQVAMSGLGIAYIQFEKYREANEIFQKVKLYGDEFGCEWASIPASMFIGVAQLALGNMSEGFKKVLNALDLFKESGRKPLVALTEYILGKIYFMMIKPKAPIEWIVIFKNSVFLLKYIPFAKKRAEYHFKKSIELAEEIHAMGILGQTYYDLGYFYLSQKKMDNAYQCFSKSIKIFEECGADVYLNQAKEAIASLED